MSKKPVKPVKIPDEDYHNIVVKTMTASGGLHAAARNCDLVTGHLTDKPLRLIKRSIELAQVALHELRQADDIIFAAETKAQERKRIKKGKR